MTTTDLALDALAVYRLTRLAVEDEITDGVRTAAEHWLQENSHHKLAYLVTCPWCSGMWLAAGCAMLRARAPEAWRVVRWPLAMSAVSGLIAERV
jgi:hypothetical protein